MFLKQLQNKNCCVCLYRGTGAGRLWPNPNNGNTVRYFRKLSWCLIRGWISHIWQTWLINKLLASQIPYSSSSPGTYVVTDRFFFLHLWCCLSWKKLAAVSVSAVLLSQGPPGGAGGGGCPPGTPIMPSPAGNGLSHPCLLATLLALLPQKWCLATGCENRVSQWLFKMRKPPPLCSQTPLTRVKTSTHW